MKKLILLIIVASIIGCTISESKHLENSLKNKFNMALPDTSGTGVLIFSIYTNEMPGDYIKIKGVIDKSLNILPQKHIDMHYSQFSGHFVESWEWETVNSLVTFESHNPSDTSLQMYAKVFIQDKN